jgi:glucose-1-phosphatase
VRSRRCCWSISAGVLFSFDHEHRLNVLGKCLGLPPGRVDELLWQSGFSADCDAGRCRDAAAIRAQIRRITGYAGSDERLDADREVRRGEGRVGG